MRSLAGVFLSVGPRNEMVFPRESRERTAAIWCHGGKQGADRVNGLGGGKGPALHWGLSQTHLLSVRRLYIQSRGKHNYLWIGAGGGGGRM